MYTKNAHKKWSREKMNIPNMLKDYKELTSIIKNLQKNPLDSELIEAEQKTRKKLEDLKKAKESYF